MMVSVGPRVGFVGVLATLSFSVVACDASGSGSGIPGRDAPFDSTTAIDGEWARCVSALADEWPDYTLGLVDKAGFLGITEPATACTATGPQGQLLWLALTEDDRRFVFVEGGNGLPVPAP
jgi:hypothetical protein